MLTLVPAALLAALSAAAPITLDEALAEAARANADIALARASADLGGVDAYASYAGVLPRLDLSAAFGHQFTGASTQVTAFPQFTIGPNGVPVPVLDQDLKPVFAQSAVAIPATDNEAYTLGLTLQLPLFDGARSWNAIRRARTSATAAARSLDETALGVAFETARRFYEVVKAAESLRVLEATVDRSREIVRRAEALFEAGRGSRADVLTAQGNLGNDRIAVEQQRAILDQARANLAVILGRDAGAPLDVVPPGLVAGPALPSTAPPAADAELLEKARRARPLILAQAEGVRAAELDESIARGGWSPVVSARGSYNRSGPALSGHDGVYGPISRQYVADAQVVVAWNLFNGRQTLADEQRAAIAARRARAQAAQAEQQVSNEIARARASVIALSRAAGIAAENLATAQQGVALARERLDAGAATQLEVRDASLKLTQAELSLVQARVDHAVASADLNRAVGGAL
jgi:outer membrane protein